MTDDDRIEAMIKTLRAFIRAEDAHAGRVAGGNDLSARDEADIQHANLVNNFTAADCDAALKRLARRRKSAR